MESIRIPQNFTDSYPEWDWEDTIDSSEFSQWCHRNMYLGICLALTYVIGVFAGKKYMEGRPSFNLRTSMMLWSALLAVFSIVAAYRTTIVMWYLYKDNGIEAVLCSKYFYLGPIARFWGPVFVGSKIFEYLDTAFIVLQKKPLIFLHWSHHFTVSLLAWYVYGGQYSGGGVFMTVNFQVHAIMYSYYTLRAAGYRLPKPVAVFITATQITQMFIGSWTVYQVYQWRHKESCNTSPEHAFFSSLVYLSYLVLFCRFFYGAYLVKKPKKTKSTSEKDQVLSSSKITIKKSLRNGEAVRRRVAATTA